MDAAAALDHYDSLAPVRVKDLIGSWRGETLTSGHPLDGLLERLRWHGKRFAGPEDAYPLVFQAGDGRTVSINPAFVPLAAVLRHRWLRRAPFLPTLFGLVCPLLTTRRPTARLRLMEYRGVVTATMVYDALPVSDAFRAVDQDTLVGAMDARGMRTPFLFVLHRESPTP
jgi:hypothetical protein